MQKKVTPSSIPAQQAVGSPLPCSKYCDKTGIGKCDNVCDRSKQELEKVKGASIMSDTRTQRTGVTKGFVAAFLVLVLGTGTVNAEDASGTWNIATPAGMWDTASNWMTTPINLVPEGVGQTATIQCTDLSGSGTKTFTLNSSHTLGILNVGANKNSAIQVSNSAVMTLDNTDSSNVQINLRGSAGGQVYLYIPIKLRDSLDINNAVLNDSAKPLHFMSGASISSDTAGNKTITNLGSGQVNINSIISDGVGTVSLIQQKTGGDDNALYALSLANGNTYSGSTTLKSGYLALKHTNALQRSTLIMDGGKLLFDKTGTNYCFGGLSSSTYGLGYDIALTNTAGVAVPLSVGANGSNTTYAGVLSQGGSLTKAGSGTLTLSGGNTYTGATTVVAGTLALGASNVLPTTPVSIGNATLAVATDCTDEVGTLAVTGTAFINLGTNSVLVFADSRDRDWSSGTLTITGAFASGSSLKFGTSNEGLTDDQIKKITAPGAPPLILSSSGFLLIGKKMGTILRVH
jgi:fibronectin-binding autotransporter adhesin